MILLQGLITYANENIQNWFTTLADSFRVSDDMGKLRFQFKVFHKPLFGWKGSYVVTQVSSSCNSFVIANLSHILEMASSECRSFRNICKYLIVNYDT